MAIPRKFTGRRIVTFSDSKVHFSLQKPFKFLQNLLDLILQVADLGFAVRRFGFPEVGRSAVAAGRSGFSTVLLVRRLVRG